MPPDLYTEILGLPPEPRPLNYYELLGLPLFEADRAVIHAAVLRQTKELKRWALHPDPATMLRIQEMLNEVNRAGFDLEDPKTRADYERQLADRLGIPLPQREVPPTPPRATVGSPERAPGTGGVEDTVEQANRGSAGVATIGAIRELHPPGRVQHERAEAIPESDSAAGLRPARSRALITTLALGIPLAGAAIFWVGFLVGRTTSPDGDPRTKEVRNAPPSSEPRVVVEPPRPAALQVYTAWPFDAAEAKRRQEESARALGVPVEQEIDLDGGVKMAFVLIPAGEFLMGDDNGDYNERPAHRVTLSRRFWLGKCEVTQEQWQAVMAGNPSYFKGAKNPVECVSWTDCQDFLRKLNEKVRGQTFRLPTEAEWEYACRAGTATHFSFGDSDAGLEDHAWFKGNSGQRTRPVGGKRPNAWRLCDMHGNVWEWCSDWFGPYPGGAQDDPSGPLDGQARVLRGGSWSYEPKYCRSVDRQQFTPGIRNLSCGFRVVFVPGP